ncbi:MAG: glucosamine-6-phosphate deaminase [Bacteriovoracia bacterium]
MRIIQCGSKEEAIETVASMLVEKVESHPETVVGLATGRTMEPVYEALVSKVRETGVSLSQSFFFMLDEYIGLPDDHPSSFKHYIKTHLLAPLSLDESQIAFPPATTGDGGSYEKLLQEKGGIDLQLLGIGKNGHIGFNEPGSDKNSRTRVVTLAQETIEANRDQFSDIIPKEALSMGIGTILESKSLLMLVTGKSKADAIKYLLNHHDDPSCPATFLKGHPHFTLVLDPDAASRINLNI